MNRPCERCGNGSGDELYDSNRPEAMCSEIHISNNVVSWLCFDCRKGWFKELGDLRLAESYEKAMLRYEFWKARVSYKSEKSDVEEGISLQKRVRDIESQINEHASQWLIV